MSGLKAASELSEADEKRVLRAFEEYGTQRLKPVFEALDQEIPYDELHIWRLIYRVKFEQ